MEIKRFSQKWGSFDQVDRVHVQKSQYNMASFLRRCKWFRIGIKLGHYKFALIQYVVEVVKIWGFCISSCTWQSLHENVTYFLHIQKSRRLEKFEGCSFWSSFGKMLCLSRTSSFSANPRWKTKESCCRLTMYVVLFLLLRMQVIQNVAHVLARH